MSKESETRTATEIRISPIDNCRFAYTINNRQPVLCSWISDQPLFFNEAEVIEEDDILDDPVFKALEKDIQTLRHKTGAYEKIAASFMESPDVAARNFREDAMALSGGAKIEASAPLTEILGKSRFGALLLSFADTQGVTFRDSRQILDATYDRDSKTILIRPDLESGVRILLVARELRRVWQHRNGAGLHALTFHPDYAILINRAQQADMAIAMVRIAWELQLAGDKSAWMRIENSTMSDLGRAFVREACSDFRSLNSGKAALACFEAWFLSERCRKTDRVLIQQMLADYQGYVFSDNVETSRSIAIDMLNRLGEMPFGTNYLSGSISPILADTVFTDVRDRSNANFLWFIKFERSFRDAEGETAAPVAKSAVKRTKMVQPDARPSAEIIDMPPAAEAASKKILAGHGGGDIVLFLNPRR